MSYLDGPLLFNLLQAGDRKSALWWQRAVTALADVHQRGQYLSQAFTRNCIGIGERVAMFDVEDDPQQVMPLAQAQARDWLAFLYTSAMTPPGPDATMATWLRPVLIAQSPGVQNELRKVTRLMARWLPSRRGQATRGWRRYLGMLQSTQSVLSAALFDAVSIVHTAKTPHARHH
jgi:hypothetical protein